MTNKLLQQALNEAKADAIEVFTYEDGIAQSARDAIEYMHSWLGVYFEKQALAQQEQCGCREGECETKKDKTCRMTIEIAERDGIPEWTPAIGIECAISSLRDDAARLRDGSYTPLQIADDLNVIANDLGKCNPVAQQEQPSRTERQIRRMFCVTYASDSSPYMDDGEAQDNSMHPCIDFLRDSPEQIQSKMVERAIAKHKVQQEQLAQVPFKWYDGAPPFPQNQESFIAQTIYGERVVLRVLPEEYAYDYTTADGTYMKAENIKKWMQFPDCEFLPPEPAPTQPAQKPDLWKTQFLTDVMTSAGLLRYGRTDKKLAQRIADGSARWRTELYTHSAPTQPALSDAQILNIWAKTYVQRGTSGLEFAREVIKAHHCNGGLK